MQRIYTPKSDSVEHAMSLAVERGLVSPKASQAERLSAVVRYAETHLVDEADRDERLKAYEELARDQDRSEAIRASVLDGARRGLI